MTKLRVVFAGSPAVAVPSLTALLDAGHEVVAVVTREDAPVGRRRVLTATPVALAAEAVGLPVIRANRLDDEVTAQIEAFAPDLGVVVAYGGLLREPLLSTPRHGWLNLHFSLLPRWRGAAPVQHAILAGDAVTGVSVFRLVPELDAGPLLAQVSEPIGRFQTAGALLERLSMIGAGVLAEVVDGIAAGTARAVAQRGQATPAGKLHAADGVIDWTASAASIDRRIRALTPEPGASTTVAGERLRLLEAAPAHSAHRLAPGEVAVADRQVLVGTGDGLLELVRVTPAGRQPMTAADWLRGRAREAATVLGG